MNLLDNVLKSLKKKDFWIICFKGIWRVFVVAILFGSIAITWWIVNLNNTPEAKNFLDYSLGSNPASNLGALFAGLAFVSFMLAFFLQMQEFREARKVLTNSAIAQNRLALATETLASAQEGQVKKEFLMYELKQLDKAKETNIKFLQNPEVPTIIKISSAYTVTFSTYASNTIIEELRELTSQFKTRGFTSKLSTPVAVLEFTKLHKEEVLDFAKNIGLTEEGLEDYINTLEEEINDVPTDMYDNSQGTP